VEQGIRPLSFVVVHGALHSGAQRRSAHPSEADAEASLELLANDT